MTTLTAFAFVLLAFSAPVFADPPPPPSEAMTVRLSLKDGSAKDASAAHDFKMIIPSNGPCGSVKQKARDSEFEVMACPSHDAHLTLDWRTRTMYSEYHSTSSIPFEHGSTAELGSTTGPRLIITVE